MLCRAVCFVHSIHSCLVLRRFHVGTVLQGDVQVPNVFYHILLFTNMSSSHLTCYCWTPFSMLVYQLQPSIISNSQIPGPPLLHLLRSRRPRASCSEAEKARQQYGLQEEGCLAPLLSEAGDETGGMGPNFRAWVRCCVQTRKTIRC